MNRVHRLASVFVVFFLLLALGIFYFFKPPGIPSLPGDYPPSQPIRLLLDRNLNQLRIRSEGRVSLLFGGTDREVKILLKDMLATYKGGVFEIAGFNRKSEWVLIRSEERVLECGDRVLPGAVRLVAKDENHFYLVNEVPLERYIARVVEGEVDSSWPMETLKAQAIVARTYAIQHMLERQNRAWDLLGDSRSQAYSRIPPDERSRLAVLDTAGVILTWQGKPFTAYYISTCGGATDPAWLSFPNERKIPPLGGVHCPYCTDSPFYRWDAEVEGRVMTEVLEQWTGGKPVQSFSLKTLKGGRVLSIAARTDKGTVEIPGMDFRRKLNARLQNFNIKSLKFQIYPSGDGYLFRGRGWGYHASGMCQYGAYTLGRRNMLCLTILETYFPGSELGVAPIIRPVQ